MKILIIEATRGIGRALLSCARQEGHEVRVLVRDPARLDAGSGSLEVIRGDIRDAEAVRSAARDQEAVCSCIGSPLTFGPVDLFSVGARNLVAALQENPACKLVAVTGIGAGDSKGHGGFLYDRLFKPLVLKTIYEDKDREEEIIKASGLHWLIVRPAGLTNGPRTGVYRVINDLTGITAKRISRLDVADFILKELAKPENFGRTPLLTY